MVGATTAGDIITAAKRRADMENSTFISDSEWLNMCNASVQQLYEKIVEAYGNEYEFGSAFQVTTDGINYAFSLATCTTFFKLLGVDLLLSGSGATAERMSLKKFMFADRNRFSPPGAQLLLGRTNIRYRLVGNNLWLKPLPQGGLVVELWYAPRFTPFTATTDSFDGINGWEEWAVNDMALKALTKEESPLDGVQALQAVQNDRLMTIINNRDAGSPQTTVDVYSTNSGDIWNGGWDSGGGWGP